MSLKITGGLRYLKENKHADVTGTGSALSAPAGGFDLKDSAVMGTAALSYLPTPSTGYYVRYSRGYKSGAINSLLLSAASLANAIVKPETTDAYEFGAKYVLLDNRLSANFALFTQTVDDQQVQVFKDASFVSLNAARVRSRGLEADIAYQLAPSLRLTLGGTVLDSKYLNFANAPAFAGSGGSATQDLSGQTTMNAPKLTLVLGAEHRADLGSGYRLTSAVSVRHATSYFTDLGNSPSFKNGDTNFVDASFEIGTPFGLSAQLWGRNLTNQNAFVTGIATPAASTPGGGSLAAFVNDPRTVGITLKYKY